MTVEKELPTAVIATRESPGSPWLTGPERDREHRAWMLRTGDPETRRHGHSTRIAFDAPIAIGATLADPAFRTASQVRRALCVGAVEEGFGDGPLAALGTASLLLRLDWLVRWREDRGIHRLSLLRPPDLRDFAHALRAGRVLGLVDLDARLSAVADPDLAGVLDLDGDPLAIMDSAGLARLLGVTVASLRNADSILREALARRVGRSGSAAPGGSTPVGSAGSRDGVEAHLEVWTKLRFATKRGWLPDGLEFDPFKPGRGAGTIASRMGGTVGRTHTLEPIALFGLLGAAARTSLSRGPAIAAAVRLAAGGTDYERAAAEIEVRHLAASVAVLIGGISGRRGGETASVRRGAFFEGPHGPELTTHIGKSGGAVLRVPVPAIAAAAVLALDALPRGGDATDPWVFRIVLPWGRVIEIGSDADLAAFAAAEGLGTEVDLSSHQLRRAMSLLWEYAYRAGTPAGLARALRHNDLGTGEIYVTEAMPGRVAALRDGISATTKARVSAMDPGLRARLLTLRERLRDPCHPLGRPPCSERYGRHPLALLDAWASSLDAPSRTGSPSSALGVRIGSRAALAGDGPSLLSFVCAHAAALARLGVLP